MCGIAGMAAKKPNQVLQNTVVGQMDDKLNGGRISKEIEGLEKKDLYKIGMAGALAKKSPALNMMAKV